MTQGLAAPDVRGDALPGCAEVQSSLGWMIAPVPKSSFFEQYWEKQLLVVARGDPNYFTGLLSLSEVDRVLTTLDRRYPDVVLKNAADQRVADVDYTLAGGALDVSKVYQLFEQGSTIALAFLDSVLPVLTLFCRKLESEISCPFQTNVYMTPPGAQGARPHYDTHDVFVLQIAGSKKWTIFGTPVELPLANQNFDAALHPLGEPTCEFVLQAGDMAYIPRGIAHEARSTDTVSLHITVGALQRTWAELLLEAVAEASLREPALRQALPAGFARSGFDRTQAKETLAKMWRQIAATADLDGALDGFVDRFLAACPPVLEGQMAQLAALDEVTSDSIAGARPGLVFRWETNGASEVLEYCNRKITFPPQAREAVRFALSHPRFAVKTLPGELDDAGKVTLIRRLIREGLAMLHAD